MTNIRLHLLVFLLIGAGCSSDTAESPDPVVLGAVYDLSGDQSALDIPSSNGAQLAIDQINAAGGVKGREVNLVLKDGQTDTMILRARVMEILSEQPSTVALLGLSDTDQVLAAAAAAADSQRVFMTSGATSPKLPGQIPDYLFLACFGDNVQAAAAAEWVYKQLNARTACIIYDSTETYTRLLQGYFFKRFEELGGQVLLRQAYAQGNVVPAVQSIIPSDIIFFSALPQDAPAGVQSMRQAGIMAPVIGGDGFDEPESWEGLTEINDVYFTTHAYLGVDNPDPGVQAFRTAYLEAYAAEPSAFAALGYDAAQLLVAAVEHATTNSPEGVRLALVNIQNFAGVTGSISYGPNTRIPKKSVTILQIAGGKQQLVTSLVPEQVPEP